MKLSFSTRGWPDLTWEEMIETALEMGFSGIEVYNLPKFDPMLEKGGPFHKHKVAATVRQLRDHKLTIPCFDTSLDLSDGSGCVSTLTELMQVARNAHVPYVVAFALNDNEEQVRQNLSVLEAEAEKIKTEIMEMDIPLLRVTGPTPAVISKISDIYRRVIYLKHEDAKELYKVREMLDEVVKNGTIKKEIKVDFDENPLYAY